MSTLVTKQAVLNAYKKLRKVVKKTPLQYDQYLSEKYNANIYLKREDLQVVRSFKLRGAYYAINELSDENLVNGIVCASAGNHAQGVAFTSNEKEIKATIYMPNTTPTQKIDQVKYFGGDYVNIVIEGDTFDESNSAAHIFASENEMSFIEPYNDPNVIAGQGTVGVEIHQDLVADGITADAVLVPIGGGGLISGISSYLKEAMPETKIIGVEPSGAASMNLAFENKGPATLTEVDKFCDGTAVARVGDLNYEHASKNVDQIEVVEEGKVSQAILEMYTKQAIVTEPSGALTVAVLDNVKAQIVGKDIVCVISGGNNDISRMGEIEEKALIYSGMKQYFVVNFPQRPGALLEFVSDVLTPGDDIAKFEYTKKISRAEGPALVGVQLGKYENLPGLLERLGEFDPNYINVSKSQTLYSFLI